MKCTNLAYSLDDYDPDVEVIITVNCHAMNQNIALTLSDIQKRNIMIGLGKDLAATVSWMIDRVREPNRINNDN